MEVVSATFALQHHLTACGGEEVGSLVVGGSIEKLQRWRDRQVPGAIGAAGLHGLRPPASLPLAGSLEQGSHPVLIHRLASLLGALNGRGEGASPSPLVT